MPRVREIHNLKVLHVGDRTEISLHLKLPGELSLDEAHAVATAVEASIEEALPGVDVVHTHLEPLVEESVGTRPPAADVRFEEAAVHDAVREATGSEPTAVRFLDTAGGRIVFVTLAVDPDLPLSTAHERAMAAKARIRAALPDVADAVVHTEPVAARR